MCSSDLCYSVSHQRSDGSRTQTTATARRSTTTTTPDTRRPSLWRPKPYTPRTDHSGSGRGPGRGPDHPASQQSALRRQSVSDAAALGKGRGHKDRVETRTVGRLSHHSPMLPRRHPTTQASYASVTSTRGNAGQAAPVARTVAAQRIEPELMRLIQKVVEDYLAGNAKP